MLSEFDSNIRLMIRSFLSTGKRAIARLLRFEDGKLENLSDAVASCLKLQMKKEIEFIKIYKTSALYPRSLGRGLRQGQRQSWSLREHGETLALA